MYRVIILVFIILLSTIGATKYAGDFQELGVGGRPCAMGGAGVAQFVDPSVLYFNPAGSFYCGSGALAMHAENFAGLVRNEFGAVVLNRDKIAMGFGVQYLSVNDIILTRLEDTTSPPGYENPPLPYDTVGTRDMIIYINGAKGGGKFSYGMNIKIFYRDLSIFSGFGGGIDLGFVYHWKYITAGFAVRDFVLAPLIWNNDNKTKELIMPKFSFGIAPEIPLEQLHSIFKLECDFIKYFELEGYTFNIGMEYGYKGLLFARFGRNEGNYTFGAGLKYKRLRLDYALVFHSELRNSNKISAGVSF